MKVVPRGYGGSRSPGSLGPGGLPGRSPQPSAHCGLGGVLRCRESPLLEAAYFVEVGDEHSGSGICSYEAVSSSCPQELVGGHGVWLG